MRGKFHIKYQMLSFGLDFAASIELYLRRDLSFEFSGFSQLTDRFLGMKLLYLKRIFQTMNKDVSKTSDKGKDRTGSHRKRDDVIRRTARRTEQDRLRSEPKADQGRTSSQESTSNSKGLMTKSGKYSTSSHRERKPEGDWPKKKDRGTSKSSQRQSYAAPRYADSSSVSKLRNADQKKKRPPLVGGTLEDARNYINGLKESDPESYEDYRNFNNLRMRLADQGVENSVSIASKEHPDGYEISKEYSRLYKIKSHDSQEESSRSQRETTGQLRLTQSDEIRRQRIKEEDEKSLRDRGLEPESW